MFRVLDQFSKGPFSLSQTSAGGNLGGQKRLTAQAGTGRGSLFGRGLYFAAARPFRFFFRRRRKIVFCFFPSPENQKEKKDVFVFFLLFEGWWTKQRAEIWRWPILSGCCLGELDKVIFSTVGMDDAP